MKPCVAILLGRSVWTRGARGWCRKSLEGTGGISSPAVSHLAEIVSEQGSQKLVVVYEPEGIAHQAVETPRVSRSVFASLARVRSDHPVVMSERLGWGIEPPESVNGGPFMTLLHSELTPGLAHLRDACSRAGNQLAAAWPAYTAALASVRPSSPASGAKVVVIMTPDFVAVAAYGGGKRSFRSWVGPMSDKDWKAFSALVGDSEPRTSHPMPGVSPRRGAIAVIADGEPQRLCPVWGEIKASGRLEAVLGIDELASGAARIRTGHPANMADSFTRPLVLDRYLLCASAAAALAALLFAVSGLRCRSRLSDEGEALRARETLLDRRLVALERNRKEMAALRDQAPEDPGIPNSGRHGALVGLAAGIPDSVTLTGLSLGKDDTFEIGAIVVGADFDQESLRQALERSGFKPSDQNGWAFDAGSGRLVIRGRYGAPST